MFSLLPHRKRGSRKRRICKATHGYATPVGVFVCFPVDCAPAVGAKMMMHSKTAVGYTRVNFRRTAIFHVTLNEVGTEVGCRSAAPLACRAVAQVGNQRVA